MKLYTAFPAFLLAAVAHLSGVSTLPTPTPEAKNVSRPKLPCWSSDGPASPLLPPIPNFRLHGGGYKSAPSSSEYLDDNKRHPVYDSDRKDQVCKSRTSHQAIGVAVIED